MFPDLLTCCHAQRFKVILKDKKESKRKRGLVWETVVHTENRFIYTQGGSYRDCTLDISRKIKNKLNVLKFSFSWGFTNTFRAVYMTCGPRACEHSRHLFRITWKISPFGPCHFKIIARNIKAIFKENFSSLRVDPGKIFEITIFTRGPNVTGIYALYLSLAHKNNRK